MLRHLRETRKHGNFFFSRTRRRTVYYFDLLINKVSFLQTKHILRLHYVEVPPAFITLQHTNEITITSSKMKTKIPIKYVLTCLQPYYLSFLNCGVLFSCLQMLHHIQSVIIHMCSQAPHKITNAFC